MRKTGILLLVLFGYTAFSQGLIGPKIGLGISTFKHVKAPEGGTKNAYTSSITPQIGVMFNAKLGDYVALRPELLYFQRGAKIKHSAGSATFALHYAELPFNVVGGIPIRSAGKIEVYAGPSVGYMFGGNLDAGNGVNYEVKGADRPTHIEEGSQTVYFNYLNISMNAGIGYNWKGLVFQVGYNLGFSNLNPHAEDRKSEAEKNRSKDVMKASAVTFGVAYLFGGKD